MLDTALDGNVIMVAQLRNMYGRTKEIRFFSSILEKLMRKKKEFRISVEFDERKNWFRITPCPESPIRLYPAGEHTLQFVATNMLKHIKMEREEIKRVFVVLDPKEFGFREEDLIHDKDAAQLFPKLKKLGFENYPFRASPNNAFGDLVITCGGKLFSLHISRAAENFKTQKVKTILRHKNFGKLVYQAQQATEHVGSTNIAIINIKLKESGIFTEEALRLLTKHIPLIIFTDFNDGWEDKVAKELYENLRDWSKMPVSPAIKT